MYVCICTGITDTAIREAVRDGAKTLGDLSAMTGCSTVCGSCGELAVELLEEERAKVRTKPLALAVAAA